MFLTRTAGRALTLLAVDGPMVDDNAFRGCLLLFFMGVYLLCVVERLYREI